MRGKTVQKNEEWQSNFRNFSMRVGFNLALSKAMLEMLCAVAEGVMWDRSLYHSTQPMPDNWIASNRSLEKRGLIRRMPARIIEANYRKRSGEYEWSCYELTPAGKKVVELIKLAGMFVEADAAINKKARRA